MPPPPALRHRSRPSQLKFRRYFNSPAPQGNRPAACATEDGPERPLAKAARVLPSGRGSSLSRAEPPPPPPAPAASGRTEAAAPYRAAPPREPARGAPRRSPEGKVWREARPLRAAAPTTSACRPGGQGPGQRPRWEGGLMAAAAAQGCGRGAGRRAPVAAMAASPSPQPPLNTMGRP